MGCKGSGVTSSVICTEIEVGKTLYPLLTNAVPKGKYSTIYQDPKGNLYIRQGISLDTLSTVFSDNVSTWSGIASSCMTAAHSTLEAGHHAIHHLEVAGNVLGTFCDFLGVFQTAVDLKDIYHEVRDGQGFFIREKSRMAFNAMRIFFFFGGLLACASLVTRWIPRCARSHSIITKAMLSTFLVAKICGATDAVSQAQVHSSHNSLGIEHKDESPRAKMGKDVLAFGHHVLGAVCIVLALVPMKQWMNARTFVRVSVGFGLGAGVISTLHYAPQLYQDYKERQKLTKLVAELST